LALALWPAALAAARRPAAEAEEALEEALAAAAAAGHGPTRCAALTRLCCDYMRLSSYMYLYYV
jgi:hypothetical protein